MMGLSDLYSFKMISHVMILFRKHFRMRMLCDESFPAMLQTNHMRLLLNFGQTQKLGLQMFKLLLAQVSVLLDRK